ncbi:acylneuraminate cytidylyltransferase family protein [Phaeodactylibacter sp.]|uniref:acylneuraminate cytidylyltransferase family protein n=1 Tax=Phaeodactylibacter sp. TaxID=1940289 RepID=UPI0025DBF7AA|nr:acylneuraminate cytidylyltransferase family protein [Phaeodactylibacter sp.]MCI5055367.1 acylneuraminate cytidylyltransferase family protein [Flavobacteriales bacterium]MCI5090787.1 acylneuraminate cytidylyltransferase family protein [Phaeodactylibacter sp.]
MYQDKEVIAIIPARGGSKGIPKKNMIKLGGYPLIYWTIVRAQRSNHIDRIIVSSDDDEILSYSESIGAEALRRPLNLATDTASSVDVVLHVLEYLGLKESHELILLLQPTSPLRTTETIDKSIKFCLENAYKYVMSVSPLQKSPYHFYLEGENNILIPLYSPEGITSVRRQDLPTAYTSNGAIYLVDAHYFTQIRTFKPENIHAFKMSDEESIDIDTLSDLNAAEKLIRLKNIQA